MEKKKTGRPRTGATTLEKEVIIKCITDNPLNIKEALDEAYYLLNEKFRIKTTPGRLRYLWYGSRRKDPAAMRQNTEVFVLQTRSVKITNQKRG